MKFNDLERGKKAWALQRVWSDNRLRRGIYVLPSIFTVANLLCGYYAILVALDGQGRNFDNAAIAIIARWSYRASDGHEKRNALGLGKNSVVVTGTGSDSLLVFQPSTKIWTVMRVPYPLGFYSRGLDGRIDDPNAGWKGRGIWSDNDTRTTWHVEGGKGTPSQLVHFQVRPDPLAK
jgi:hypothetical protein